MGVDKNLIINEIQLIRSRTVAKSVIEKLWNSDQRNNLHIFDTKIYRPSGYVQREFLKRFFSFGLYEPSSKKELKIILIVILIKSVKSIARE